MTTESTRALVERARDSVKLALAPFKPLTSKAEAERVLVDLDAWLAAHPPQDIAGAEEGLLVAAADDEPVKDCAAAEIRFSGPHLRPGDWAYDGHGMIWAPSLKGGMTHIVDVRGWGYLIGGGHGALDLPADVALETQHSWGRTIVAAVSAHFAEKSASAAAINKDPTTPALAGQWDVSELVEALKKIIDMNIQYAIDRWGDAAEAESMACVTTARQAIASFQSRQGGK